MISDLNKHLVPAEAVLVDIMEPKSAVVPSEAPPSEHGFTRQLLKDGGEEKVVPPPERNAESEKLRKSEEDGAEGVLLALVNRRPGGEKNIGGEKMISGGRETTQSPTDATVGRRFPCDSSPSSRGEQQQRNQRGVLLLCISCSPPSCQRKCEHTHTHTHAPAEGLQGSR